MKPTDQQWALAMLTTAADHDPHIFELGLGIAREAG
jgi:hypothetical protein